MRTKLALTALAALLALTACSSGPTQIEDAYEECGKPRHIKVRDEGATLTISSEGAERDGASIDDVACILHQLDVPDRTVAKIDSTRALDGTMADSWDGLTAEWSYHPDSGMAMVIYVSE